MRLGYELNQNNPGNVYIIKYAIGATALAVTGDAQGDWNVSSSNELYAKLKANVITTAMSELEHVMRRIPVFRGFTWIQGEQDCVSGRGAAYEDNLTDFYSGVVAHINSLGYDTPNLRLLIFRTKNGGSAGYDLTDYANVVSGQTAVGAIYGTSISTDAIPLADTQHYNTIGINTMGEDAVDYFDDYQEDFVYSDIPDPPTFTDTHTLIQATTGNAIQSGDTGGKTDLLVGSDYDFMQFNGLSSTYRIKSLDDTDPSTWATIGSPSPQDYAHSVAVSDVTYSFYNLKFDDTDNMIKLPGSDPTRDYTYQNLILDGGAFAGFLINENVSDQDYGNFTWNNVSVSNVGGESWYLGKTGGNSLAYYRGITSLNDCYSTNSGRESIQFNGHQEVRVERFLAINGGLDTGAGIGQNNAFQLQDVYTGYFKKCIFWNFPAPGMIATDDFLFEDCFIYFTNTTRTIFLQSLPSNDYTEMVHPGGTVTFRRCTFYNPDFVNDVMFTMQNDDHHYVFEDCIFPLSVDDVGESNNDVDEICDDQRADKVTYSVTITGSTYTNTPNIPSFCDPPEAEYVGFQKVVCDQYYYNLGYGPRNPNGL